MSYGLPFYSVNTASLGLFVEYPFYKTTCVNLKLDIVIQFHSFMNTKGMFGANWQFSYETSLHVSKKKNMISIQKSSGQVVLFESQQNLNFSDGAFYLLKPLGQNNGILYEYSDYYLYEDKKKRLYYKYQKSNNQSICYLSQVMDNNGNTMQIFYRPDGTIEKIIDPFKRSIRFAYDHSPYCTAVLLDDGREAFISYNNQGRIEKIINFTGTPILFTYHSQALIESIVVGKKQKTTRFTYIKSLEKNLVKTVTDRDGSITNYEMISSNPETVQVTDPLGNVKKYVSRKGLAEQIIDSYKAKTEITYQNGLPVSVVDKNGHQHFMEYDNQGNIIRKIDPAGNTESYLYDNRGNLLSFTDKAGNTTTLTYNQYNNLIRMELSGGQFTVLDYDSLGRLIKVSQPNGNNEYYEYDTYSNITLIRDNLGELVKANYQGNDTQSIEYWDANGNRTEVQFDELDRMRLIKFADGTTKTFEYDCCTGVSTQDQSDNIWLLERDPMSRIIKSIDPTGNILGYQYDATGNLIQKIDAMGNKQYLEYNKNGLLVKTTDSMNNSTHTKYDILGKIVEIIDEQNNSTHFEYNQNELLCKVINPLGYFSEYKYDVIGKPVSKRTPGQNNLSYTYDIGGNLVSKSVNGQITGNLTYTAMDEIATFSDATGQTKFEYDIRNRVTGILYEHGKKLLFFYGACDLITTIEYPNGLKVNYTYNSMNRIETISWNDCHIQLTYDRVGRVSLVQRSNNTKSHYQYDNNHRSVHIEHRDNDELLAKLTYQYDGSGNLVEESQLIPKLDVINEQYTLEESTISFNEMNQIIKRNDNFYTYDSEGNLVEISGNQPENFCYDAENRLIQKKSSQAETAYNYNTINQLVTITHNGTKIYRYYDQTDQFLYESDEEQNDTCYIYGLGQMFASVNKNRDSFFYHYDQRGNTSVVTNYTGEVRGAYLYSPYGNILSSFENEINNPFTFMGAFGVTDEKDGHFITNNRIYDSKTARFLQYDPYGFIDGYNMYAYVGGNPMTRIDPDGTIALTAALLTYLVTAGYVAYTAPPAVVKLIQSREESRQMKEMNQMYWEKWRDALYNNPELAPKILEAKGKWLKLIKSADNTSFWESIKLIGSTVAIGTAAVKTVPPALGIGAEIFKVIQKNPIKCGPPSYNHEYLR